jgi:hypothetical protein
MVNVSNRSGYHMVGLLFFALLFAGCATSVNARSPASFASGGSPCSSQTFPNNTGVLMFDGFESGSSKSCCGVGGDSTDTFRKLQCDSQENHRFQP